MSHNNDKTMQLTFIGIPGTTNDLINYLKSKRINKNFFWFQVINMAFPVCLAYHQLRTHFIAQMMPLFTSWNIKNTASINFLHADFYYRLKMPCILYTYLNYKHKLT